LKGGTVRAITVANFALGGLYDTAHSRHPPHPLSAGNPEPCKYFSELGGGFNFLECCRDRRSTHPKILNPLRIFAFPCPSQESTTASNRRWRIRTGSGYLSPLRSAVRPVSGACTARCGDALNVTDDGPLIYSGYFLRSLRPPSNLSLRWTCPCLGLRAVKIISRSGFAGIVLKTVKCGTKCPPSQRLPAGGQAEILHPHHDQVR
jgi:hypothetical protein